MPQYTMKVRRITEEVFDFILEADSDLDAHRKMEIDENVKDRLLTSREVRISVVECCRRLDT